MKGKIFGMMAVALLVAVAACSNSAASADSQTSNDSMANQQSDSALTLVKFETTAGDFVVELFNDTPIHRDNFIKLVNEGYYNGVLFHRVINQFMIQTGDPDSKTAQPGQRLGAGGPGYTLEAEIHYPQHFHRRYALAAARALVDATDLSAKDIAYKALKIASEICVYTNDHITVETV